MIGANRAKEHSAPDTIRRRYVVQRVQLGLACLSSSSPFVLEQYTSCPRSTYRGCVMDILGQSFISSYIPDPEVTDC